MQQPMSILNVKKYIQLGLIYSNADLLTTFLLNSRSFDDWVKNVEREARVRQKMAKGKRILMITE